MIFEEPKVPCHHCDKRCESCHATCKDYQIYRIAIRIYKKHCENRDKEDDMWLKSGDAEYARVIKIRKNRKGVTNFRGRKW